ncbi:hypothetical protein BJ741DRAFT_598440 [Chytriomyces cf. hyalinus JEL632]|nr:hypothetical protein BJ741DRAFT_598440 [Chytriomyces cf. hyalinus JEL632]
MSQDQPDTLKKAYANRAAQKAFRERKKQHMKDLERQVVELSQMCRIQSSNSCTTTLRSSCSHCHVYQKQAQDNAEAVVALELAVANLQKQNSLLRSLVSNGGEGKVGESSTFVQASNAIPMAHQRSSAGRSRFHTFSGVQPTAFQSMYQSSSMYEPSLTCDNKSNSFIDFRSFGSSSSSSSSAAALSNSLEKQFLCPIYSVLEPTFLSSMSSSMEDSVTESGSGSILESSIMGGGPDNLLASPEMGFATLRFPNKPYQDNSGMPRLKSDIAADRKFIASLLPSALSCSTSTPANGFANLLEMTQ